MQCDPTQQGLQLDHSRLKCFVFFLQQLIARLELFQLGSFPLSRFAGRQGILQSLPLRRFDQILRQVFIDDGGRVQSDRWCSTALEQFSFNGYGATFATCGRRDQVRSRLNGSIDWCEVTGAPMRREAWFDRDVFFWNRQLSETGFGPPVGVEVEVEGGESERGRARISDVAFQRN